MLLDVRPSAAPACSERTAGPSQTAIWTEASEGMPGSDRDPGAYPRDLLSPSGLHWGLSVRCACCELRDGEWGSGVSGSPAMPALYVMSQLHVPWQPLIRFQLLSN